MTPQEDSALFDPDLELAISSVIDSSDFWRCVGCLASRVALCLARSALLTFGSSTTAGTSLYRRTALQESCRKLLMVRGQVLCIISRRVVECRPVALCARRTPSALPPPFPSGNLERDRRWLWLSESRTALLLLLLLSTSSQQHLPVSVQLDSETSRTRLAPLDFRLLPSRDGQAPGCRASVSDSAEVRLPATAYSPIYVLVHLAHPLLASSRSQLVSLPLHSSTTTNTPPKRRRRHGFHDLHSTTYTLRRPPLLLLYISAPLNLSARRVDEGHLFRSNLSLLTG